MAVEKSKVIERLKALFPKANLSQKRLDALADKLATKPADDADEAAIDLVINGFNDVLSIEEIAKEDDRIRTLEAKTKPMPEPIPEPMPTPESTDVNKQLLDAIAKLTSDMEALKSGNLIESKKAQAQSLFSNSDVLKNMPESVKAKWLNRFDFNSEVELQDQLGGLESEYTELVQLSADNNRYSGAAGAGEPSAALDRDMLRDVVQSM